MGKHTTANYNRRNVLVRCIKTEIVNRVQVDRVVFLTPAIVSSPYLLRATGCVVDDPNLEAKLKGESEEEIITPEEITAPTEQNLSEVTLSNFEEPTIPEGFVADEMIITQSPEAEKIEASMEDDGKPKKRGGGRKKGSKNKPLNI